MSRAEKRFSVGIQVLVQNILRTISYDSKCPEKFAEIIGCSDRNNAYRKVELRFIRVF